MLSHRPQVSRNLFLWAEKQETLWAAQSRNMKIADFGYLRINLSFRQWVVEAIWNIIVQATAFFLRKGLKNERAIGYLKIVFFLTTQLYIYRSILLLLFFLFFLSFETSRVPFGFWKRQKLGKEKQEKNCIEESARESVYCCCEVSRRIMKFPWRNIACSVSRTAMRRNAQKRVSIWLESRKCVWDFWEWTRHKRLLEKSSDRSYWRVATLTDNFMQLHTILYGDIYV